MRVLIYDSHAEYYADALGRALPSIEYRQATTLEAALAHAEHAKVIVALSGAIKPELLAAANNLEWVQALTSGVDNLRSLDGIALTNCSGIHGPQMTELAVMLMTSLARDFPAMLENQKTGRWERWPQPCLAGKTACIVGIGAIAEYLAEVLAALRMTVTGVSGRRTEVAGFQRIYARNRLRQAAAEADFLIVLTPYAEDTHHIVDGAVLEAMKPSAYLVNIARGGCVDEAALAAALTSGGIAGAALDVFARSPLGPDDPVWSLPNVIVTPHIGGFSDIYREQALPILLANLADYSAGGVTALKRRLDQ